MLVRVDSPHAGRRRRRCRGRRRASGPASCARPRPLSPFRRTVRANTSVDGVPSPADDLRIALVGYGLAGRFFHAPVLSAVDGLVLSAVVTAAPERAVQVASDFPAAAVLPD